MQTPRRLISWAVVASIVVHLGLLTAVLLQRPVLTIPNQPGGPPEAIIPVLILPRAPPRMSGKGATPAPPIQLHRRPQRNLPAETPVAPLVVPLARSAEGPTQAPSPAAPTASLMPPAPPDAVRATLRATLGCTETRVPGLTREDRAGCLERFGRGAREAAYLSPALGAEKRALLDQAGAAKLAQKAAAEQPLPGGHNKPGPQDYSGEPAVATNVLDPPGHSPSKRAAQALHPLPP
ncbi:MAG: hypothetical protein ACHP9T_16310 [Caulobacterales bacterium]|jgi:hypothetical protein